jgi:peptidoglycan hydrolase-like protein with peptidoglycan-binding domain
MTFFHILRSSRAQRVLAVALFTSLATLAACSDPDPKAMAKTAEERAKASMKPVDQEAFTQKVDPETVKQVQTQLTKIYEYMGPVNGKLDAVTLNAVEAFQREQGLRPDGLLNKKTLDLLAEAAASRG